MGFVESFIKKYNTKDKDILDDKIREGLLILNAKEERESNIFESALGKFIINFFGKNQIETKLSNFILTSLEDD